MLLQFLQALESGERTPDDLLALCLRRIIEQELEVRAWVQVLPRPDVAAGPLSGIPFGVKDIFETRGMATEYGSALYEGREGAYDAHVVSQLCRAGAVLTGKTRTAAFASFDPAGTRNPRLPGHTPGGSSSGSAAAVAAGMVPFAIGTQTLGSVLRPASFCGVCGFKPSYGVISIEGALPFAPSLDTVGFFTQTAADMVALWSRGFGGHPAGELRRAARLLLPCDDAMRHAIDDAVQRLRAAGAAIDDFDPPEGWAELDDAARTINTYEGARSHRENLREFGDRIGVRLAALVREGLEMPKEAYERARAHVERMRLQMRSLFAEYPAVLSPAAPGAAPVGLVSTGDPVHNAPWTALGTPAISVPLPTSGTPLGLQITAAYGRDDALVAIAASAAALLSRNRSPSEPGL